MTLSGIGERLSSLTRKWLLTVGCLAVFTAGHAAIKEDGGSGARESDILTPLKVFADLPLEVTEMIRPSTRLDMIDNYTQADSLLVATNALGGESRFLEVAPDYLKVAVTPVSTLEVKLLPAGKKQVVMTLYTTGDPDAARDTEVLFFDSDLKPLDAAKFLKAPKPTDFFALKGSGIGERELAEKVPYAAIEYSTGPGDSPLRATLTTLRVIAEEDSDLLSTLQTPMLSAPWKGKYNFK